MNNNVNSSAKVVKNIAADTYTLGTFNSSVPIQEQNEKMKTVASLDERALPGGIDPLMAQLQAISQGMTAMQQKIASIESNGLQNKDFDKQLVQALKDLKSHATFFERATFQLETKILKTSMSIAKKIIAVEIGEQSSNIARNTINNILNKIKTASQVTIHLNPRDYVVLKDDLNLEDFIKIEEDSNVTPGGVVIASNLGNFDGNVESKIETILESLDSVI